MNEILKQISCGVYSYNKEGNPNNLVKQLKVQHSIILKQCSVFDCLSKAAAVSMSSVQLPGSDVDDICQTNNATVLPSSRQGNTVYRYITKDTISIAKCF